MTGKTTVLRAAEFDRYYDLLDPELELALNMRPALFWEQISAMPRNSSVIIDEIQRVPQLLDYVQMGMDRNGQTFFLSGSSARKLKRANANLLGGRALDLKIHPLTTSEIGAALPLDRCLRFGSLPHIASLVVEGKEPMAVAFLKSYLTTYIKEEIQAEALVRNVGPFQRFLAVAAQSNGQTIEYQNISRDCSVAASTVKEYFQILEDTLLGFYLWPHDRNERKKARPKFYFFDCGVVRAIQNRLTDTPTAEETGFLFETWMVGELHRLRDYCGKDHLFSFWRDRTNEVDMVISDGHGPVLAIECKSGTSDFSLASLREFRQKFPSVRTVVASMRDEMARMSEGTEILPWKDVLALYQQM